MYEELYDSPKISSLKGIRDNRKYIDCVKVHRVFGDIFMAYERKTSKGYQDSQSFDVCVVASY